MQDKLNIQKHHGVSWIDTTHPGTDVFAQLEHDYRLHPVHLNESIQKVQHNEVEVENNYLFLVLHIPVAHPHSGNISVGQVGIFLGKDYLITIRSSASTVITELFESCAQQDTKSDNYFAHGSGYLLYGLVSALLDAISFMVENVTADLDDIEDRVFDNNGSDAQRIGKIRQKIVRLRRLIGPKRLLLKDLTERIDEFSGKSMSKYYSNNSKTLNKLWEEIEEAKETIEIFKDADFTTSTELTNEILAVMTILFTFTIPITVVGTLYGMNVPLPGGIEAGAWTFFGPYTTFLILVVLSGSMALGMYLYFRKKHWL